MFEYMILGVVQGIAEWLPVSSEGAIVLIMTNFFGATSLTDSISTAVVLHLGTFCAALVYFRKDIKVLLQHIPSWKKSYTHYNEEERIVYFIAVTTVVSVVLAGTLLYAVSALEDLIMQTAGIITAGIGALLLITGYLQLQVKKSGTRSEKELTRLDSIFLGVAQGAAALPGLSRSGLTVSVLLLRNIQETAALRLSFLLSLPIVLIGNIALQFADFSLSVPALIGVFTAFITGLISIHTLMLLAKKINFGLFVILFGLLMMVSVFI